MGVMPVDDVNSFCTINEPYPFIFHVQFAFYACTYILIVIIYRRTKTVDLSGAKERYASSVTKAKEGTEDIEMTDRKKINKNEDQNVEDVENDDCKVVD